VPKSVQLCLSGVVGGERGRCPYLLLFDGMLERAAVWQVVPGRERGSVTLPVQARRGEMVTVAVGLELRLGVAGQVGPSGGEGE
jgi:hypothetical protein